MRQWGWLPDMTRFLDVRRAEAGAFLLAASTAYTVVGALVPTVELVFFGVSLSAGRADHKPESALA
jgi:hypothetical protein